MVKVRTPPYATVVDERISAALWLRVRGDREGALPEYLADWDAATDLHLGARLTIDLDAARADAALPGDAPLSVFAGWRSRATTLRGGTLGTATTDSGVQQLQADVVVPGAEVAGRLDLTIALVLASDLDPLPFRAHRFGARLWEAERTLDLEGTSARFPIEVVNFSEVPGKNPRAGWYLDWDPGDLSMPLLGGVRLLVNQARPRIVSAISTGSADLEAGTIRDAIILDAARSLVAGAMANAEFADDSLFESETVGEAIYRLVRSVFPGRSISNVKAAYGRRPADLDHALQAYLNTFGEPV
jgi:hypothetical protein